MFLKYLLAFLVSMAPFMELRLGVPMAVGLGIPYWQALILCVIGNMLPVPFIYLFARKVLYWGSHKKYIGKFFRFCLEKGEHAGQLLVKKAGRGGLFVALVLFVAIPVPGTGAWVGTLGASFLDMGIKSTVASIFLGVTIVGCVMALASTGVFSIFGI